jgi:hypothetical protein
VMRGAHPNSAPLRLCGENPDNPTAELFSGLQMAFS